MSLHNNTTYLPMQCILYTMQCIVRKSLEWQQTRGMYNTEVYSLIIGTYLVHSYNMNYVFNRWRPILGVVTSCALEKQISSLNNFFFKFCTWCIYNFSKLWIEKPSCTYFAIQLEDHITNIILIIMWRHQSFQYSYYIRSTFTLVIMVFALYLYKAGTYIIYEWKSF